jgi:hypothetical protein
VWGAWRGFGLGVAVLCVLLRAYQIKRLCDLQASARNRTHTSTGHTTSGHTRQTPHPFHILRGEMGMAPHRPIALGFLCVIVIGFLRLKFSQCHPICGWCVVRAAGLGVIASFVGVLKAALCVCSFHPQRGATPSESPRRSSDSLRCTRCDYLYLRCDSHCSGCVTHRCSASWRCDGLRGISRKVSFIYSSPSYLHIDHTVPIRVDQLHHTLDVRY